MLNHVFEFIFGQKRNDNTIEKNDENESINSAEEVALRGSAIDQKAGPSNSAPQQCRPKHKFSTVVIGWGSSIPLKLDDVMTDATKEVDTKFNFSFIKFQTKTYNIVVLKKKDLTGVLFFILGKIFHRDERNMTPIVVASDNIIKKSTHKMEASSKLESSSEDSDWMCLDFDIERESEFRNMDDQTAYENEENEDMESNSDNSDWSFVMDADDDDDNNENNDINDDGNDNDDNNKDLDVKENHKEKTLGEILTKWNTDDENEVEEFKHILKIITYDEDKHSPSVEKIFVEDENKPLGDNLQYLERVTFKENLLFSTCKFAELCTKYFDMNEFEIEHNEKNEVRKEKEEEKEFKDQNSMQQQQQEQKNYVHLDGHKDKCKESEVKIKMQNEGIEELENQRYKKEHIIHSMEKICKVEDFKHKIFDESYVNDEREKINDALSNEENVEEEEKYHHEGFSHEQVDEFYVNDGTEEINDEGEYKENVIDREYLDEDFSHEQQDEFYVNDGTEGISDVEEYVEDGEYLDEDLSHEQQDEYYEDDGGEGINNVEEYEENVENEEYLDDDFSHEQVDEFYENDGTEGINYDGEYEENVENGAYLAEDFSQEQVDEFYVNDGREGINENLDYEENVEGREFIQKDFSHEQDDKLYVNDEREVNEDLEYEENVEDGEYINDDFSYEQVDKLNINDGRKDVNQMFEDEEEGEYSEHVCKVAYDDEEETSSAVKDINNVTNNKNTLICKNCKKEFRKKEENEDSNNKNLDCNNSESKDESQDYYCGCEDKDDSSEKGNEENDNEDADEERFKDIIKWNVLGKQHIPF